MKQNTVETKQWLDKHYPNSAPSRQMVEKWIAEFKRGPTSTNDAERSGRPNEAVIPKTSKNPQIGYERLQIEGERAC